MGIDRGTVSVTSTGPGCLKITTVIPLHCSLHAFKMAKNKFLELRQFHIHYVEIESFPILLKKFLDAWCFLTVGSAKSRCWHLIC